MNYITPKHNYDYGYITLCGLQLDGMPGKLLVEEEELVVKPEFHISLICAEKIAALIDAERANEIEAEIVRQFMNYAQSGLLGSYELTGLCNVVTKDVRKTVVAMCEVEGLRDFFHGLEEHFGRQLPVQPAHITMYARMVEGKAAGIGILSDTELQKFAKSIELPKLWQILDLGKK